MRLNVWPEIELAPEEAGALIDRYARETEGLGIEIVIIRGRMRDPRDGEVYDRELRLFAPAGRGVLVELDEPPKRPLQPLDEGARRIVQARRRGSVHPAELVKILAPERPDRQPRIPRGEFVEHDFDDEGRLVPVDRPPAINDARHRRRRSRARSPSATPRACSASSCSATRPRRWARWPSRSAGA